MAYSQGKNANDVRVEIPPSKKEADLSMMDIFEQRNFKLNKMLLSVLGLWPYQTRERRLAIVTFVVVVVWSQLLPEIFAIIELSDDPEIVNLSITSFMTSFACISKFFNMTCNFGKIFELAERMQVDWQSLLYDPEINILHDYARRGRQFTIAYTAGMYTCLVLFMGQPAFPMLMQTFKLTNRSGPVKLPFPMYWYGIDMDAYWYHMFIHGCLVSSVIITVIIAADTMYLVYVQHACAMFTVVGHKLSRMADHVREDKTYHSEPKGDVEFRYVVDCIKKHKEAIELGELIEASYTWSFFILLGVNVLMISFTGYQMVVRLDTNPQEALRFGIFIMAEIMHLFFLSFFAERLKDHSDQFRQHLYQAEWYNTSLRTQKLLCVVIMRTSVPCQLTAGKIVTMSLESFTSVLKTSMSYFTLLRSTQ